MCECMWVWFMGWEGVYNTHTTEVYNRWGLVVRLNGKELASGCTLCVREVWEWLGNVECYTMNAECDGLFLSRCQWLNFCTINFILAFPSRNVNCASIFHLPTHLMLDTASLLLSAAIVDRQEKKVHCLKHTLFVFVCYWGAVRIHIHAVVKPFRRPPPLKITSKVGPN